MDLQLKEQLHLCWDSAIIYCQNYIKEIKSSHSINLKFENLLANYIGNSLGIAITLAFIEAILKHYNSKLIVKVNECIAVTGGIDNESNITTTSKAIIEAKVQTVFYSDAKIFCVPKTDLLWAEKKFTELKKKYPNRDLEIIGLKDLKDLLNRRNVVDIRKQKLIVRTAKFVKKNWVSAAATILLAIVFTLLFAIDFDDNPTMFQQNGNLLYVKNKNGKTLWSLTMNFSPENISQDRSQISKKKLISIMMVSMRLY